MASAIEKAKHTPAPWTASDDFIQYGQYDSQEKLAVVSNCEVVAFCCRRTGGNLHEFRLQAAANARLIASAPDMLEALKLCVMFIPGAEIHSWPPGFRLRDEAMAAATAAIAKAEGTSP